MKKTVGDNLRFLLADDDIDDRELFAEAIAEVDPSIMVSTVEDGEALMNELIHIEKVPDLIFLDLNMPKKNGKECLVEIQLHATLKKIPVVIYSTSIRSSDIEQSWSQGVLCVIRKPDSYVILKDIIKKIINLDFRNTVLTQEEKILFNLH